jgi:LuxR family transcriptional regulator, activator of conjugal transfer of Ti plasmids
MHRIFQIFIANLSNAPHADGLRDGMATAAAALDLSSFAYLSFPDQTRTVPRLISHYPSAWTTHYLQSKYERFDPGIVQALRHPEPFEWGLGSEAVKPSKPQQKLFLEAANFGIRFGFTVPIHDHRGPVAAMTFAADVRRLQFSRCINEHGRVLRLMAIYFHTHARRKLAPDRAVEGVSLSRREFEYPAWEVGHILGISLRTAAYPSRSFLQRLDRAGARPLPYEKQSSAQLLNP